MNAKTAEWRPGPSVCRCCLSEGCYKDISTEYFWMGRREVYAEMLSDTFDLTVAYSKSSGPNSNSRLICEPCIARLRDAADFKRQVQECERTFLQHLDPSASDIVLEVTAEPLEKAVKMEDCEPVKEENVPSDDDIDDVPDFGDDDDDDLDDQPLTRLASKTPKKETMDISDLLDNAKAAEKRKSSTKTKTSPAKKAKTKKDKVIAKPKPEKKKKDIGSETSIWQLTLPERKNAATFMQNTTVRPFIFKGSSFKCFYCDQYISDIENLLKHTSSHEIPNREYLLENYIYRGKRPILVDVSKLSCRICYTEYPNLDAIRDHLKVEHCLEIFPASNGMTEFIMADGKMKCQICGKDFEEFKQLFAHMTTHFRKVVCEVCGQAFLNQHLFLTHKEKHNNESVICEFCDKVFERKTQLKYHMRVIHGGFARAKASKCEHCELTFKEYYSKMNHMKKVHGISKSFKCDFCKSKFNTRRSLTEHITLKHTQKYRCEVCDKCFTNESKLKQHMLGHSDEKNFVCSVCNKAYVHSKSLKKHMRIHGDMPYKIVCALCGEAFCRKDDYTKHMKLWHYFGDADAYESDENLFFQL